MRALTSAADLAATMKRNRWSDRTLGREVGVTEGTIRALRRGRTARTHDDTAARIEQSLDVAPGTLFALPDLNGKGPAGSHPEA